MRADNTPEHGLQGEINVPHNEACWYALSIRSRHEKISASILENMAFDCFLPLIYEDRRWSDRKKRVALPLFPGYLFVRLVNLSEFHLRVLKVPGIVGFIGNKNGPAVVPENEIEDVRAALSRGHRCAPSPFFGVGDRVRVVRGALAGIEGIFTYQGPQSSLVISIALIHRSVAVTVSKDDVEPVFSVIPQ